MIPAPVEAAGSISDVVWKKRKQERKQENSKSQIPNNDGLVKSRKILMIVIPRLDRGIQSFQVIISPLDTGFYR